MKHPQTAEVIGVIWCLVFYSVGCVTSREVTTLEDLDGSVEIAVQTRDNIIFELRSWEEVDGTSISGAGVRKQLLAGSDVPIVLPFEGTIPKNAIRSISRHEVNTELTVLTVALAGAAIYGLVYLIHDLGEGFGSTSISISGPLF